MCSADFAERHSGRAFFDQSIALTISLGVSLLVAFILTPLLYAALISRRSAPLKDDTWAFRAVSRGYHKMVDKILRNRRACLLFTLLLMPLGILLAWKMPVSALPHITSSEALITIDWNEPIDAKQNAQRVKSIYADIGNKAEVFESEIGIRQFLMQNGQNTLQRAEIYIRSGNEQERVAICNRIRGWARERYPMAELTQTESPNAFTQLFDSGKPYFEARFRPLSPSETLEQQAAVRRISQKLAADKPVDGKSLRQESSLAIVPDYAKMALYGISRPAVEEALFLHFGDVAVSDIRQFGIFKRILLQMRETDLGDKLAANIPAPDGTLYPLHQFISVTDEEQPAYIFADSKGIYQSLLFDERSADFTQLRKKLEAAAASENMKVSFSGLYFENSDQLKSLLIIFLTVLLLLFFYPGHTI
ncbi:efflux RND transporter permease subunit [Chitinophaga sedimenti]|uniref:efflux RND transporter permease subunit n=1 Tax=Chitinophaga sedimenti TaxID=2033606 RepID=UPI0027E10E42|nr:efflux RND transporter permease subunit [Chitinophaga sedimenti]